MSETIQVRELDQQRRTAMIAGDTQALDRLLADDLVWTHSSGVSESKSEFIAAIAERRVQYHSLEVVADEVRGSGLLSVHQGLLQGAASRNGQSKALHAKFIAVWRQADKTEQTRQLIAWQSTNCSS